MSIFDDLIFPFHKFEGYELYRLLVETFPTKAEALDIAQHSGMIKSKLNQDQPVYYLWKDVLEMASSKYLLKKLLETTLEFLNVQHPTHIFLKALLEGKPIANTNLPQNPDGTPRFIDSTDEITKPEALLYHDDLTIQIGFLPALIKTLQILEKLAPSVCRLVVDFNGATQHGTAFRIGPDQLLTNWHVVHDKTGTLTNAITAEFGYEDDGKGGVKTTSNIICKVDNIIFDKSDDWALIRTKDPLNPLWPIIKLTEAADPILQSSAYIIQHPNSQRKRLGFVRNQVADYTDRVVHYLTDTQEGSSGAPVLNAEGRLIALHHAGGRPQQITGLPPVKKNEGIRIPRIVEKLNAALVNPD